MKCTVCEDGTFEAKQIDQWMKREDRWILFRNVAAQVCDTCSETLLSAEMTARLTSVARPDSKEFPTGFVSPQPWEYDLQAADQAVAEGKRPIAVVGTAGISLIPSIPLADFSRKVGVPQEGS